MRKSIRIFCDITHPVWALRFHTFTGDIWGTLAVVFDAQKFASAEVMRVHSSIGRWNMLQKSYQSGCTGIKREHLWFQKRKKYQWPVLFVLFCVFRIKLETILIHGVAVLAANVCVCSYYCSSALKSYSSIWFVRLVFMWNTSASLSVSRPVWDESVWWKYFVFITTKSISGRVTEAVIFFNNLLSIVFTDSLEMNYMHQLEITTT